MSFGAEEQVYKAVKRGMTGKDHSPSHEGEERGRGSLTFRGSFRGSFRAADVDQYWTPRRSILAVISSLAIFALAGSFIFACSINHTPAQFSVPHRSLKRHQKSDIAPGCSDKAAALKVYMYDLPPEFHYGMLRESQPGELWPRNVSDIPEYLGGLYRQHSLEYWLTNDLVTSNMADRESMCTAFRVRDWRSADVIFVPFFASLSYNKYTRSDQKLLLGGDRNQELQERLMSFLRRQPAWAASQGRDHVVVIHHPNSMHSMRDRLKNAIFVVADFGRYGPEIANIGKDVVAPYKHVVQSFPDDATFFESRKTLLYFQGAIVRKEGGIIRQQLYDLIKDEPGVHFEASNTSSAAIRSATFGMQGSKFCLNLAGDTPSSNRLFDSIASHCVPVIISDNIELPFEDELDYTQFCLFVKSTDALKENLLMNLLRAVSREDWTRMWRKLREVDRHFKYQHPTKRDDAVHMTWRAIARKVPRVRLVLNKQRRFKTQLIKDT